MHARKLLAGLATSAVALSGIALTAAPASAAYTKMDQDPSFTPVSADLIGGGSDTTQGSLHFAAEAWSTSTPAPAFRVASYQAGAQPAGGTITLPGNVEIPRPNGSGGGKTLLYGQNNQPEIDFARSSSALNDAEVAANLQLFPFALDTLRMAVSNSVPSNAPATLSAAQIVDIYQGDVTNWNQVGGKAGTIEPMIPQPRSGTRDFFEGQLRAMNGGTAVALGTAVTEVQEHDDTLIKSNPNAVAPFSIGRAELLGSTLRLTSAAAGTGWKADRAVYNVVRQGSLGDAKIQAFFGPEGYLCSVEARPFIEQGGLKQLATEGKGGVCGVATQSPASNFTLNEQVVTTTKLTVSSAAARTAKLTAVVTGSTSPRGTVSFYDGEKLLKGGVSLISGQATTTVSGLPLGARTYRAVFVPEAGSVFEASEATGSGVVKTSSALTAAFPKKVKAGKKAKGTVSVALAGVAAAATGTVKVLAGSKAVGSGKLSGGKVTITLAKLKAGKNKLKVIWAGDANAVGSQKSVTIKQLAKKKKKSKS